MEADPRSVPDDRAGTADPRAAYAERSREREAVERRRRAEAIATLLDLADRGDDRALLSAADLARGHPAALDAAYAIRDARDRDGSARSTSNDDDDGTRR